MARRSIRADPFRNQDPFEDLSINVFNSAGETPNFILAGDMMNVVVAGNGTTQLDLTLTFAYGALCNFEEQARPSRHDSWRRKVFSNRFTFTWSMSSRRNPPPCFCSDWAALFARRVEAGVQRL